MKNFVSVAKRVLSRAAILYTVLSLALFLFITAIPESGNMIKTADLATIFAFALLLACANLILGLERISIALRILLHYLAAGATYFVIFVVIGQKTSGGMGVFVNLLFFTIMYALVMGIYIFLYYSLKSEEKPKKEKSDKKPYQSIYKK